MTALEIILTFCDVSRIVRYRMCYIVTRHCCNAEDCDGTGSLDIYCLLITRCEAAVEISGVSTVGWNLLHRDSHFLLSIGKVCHIGKEYEYSLSFKSKLLCNSKGHIRNQCTLYDWVCSRMNKHYGVAHSAALFEGVTEFHIVIVFETHASEDDDVYFRLHGDSRKELVIRLT